MNAIMSSKHMSHLLNHFKKKLQLYSHLDLLPHCPEVSAVRRLIRNAVIDTQTDHQMYEANQKHLDNYILVVKYRAFSRLVACC
jgi:hypothetical protein